MTEKIITASFKPWSVKAGYGNRYALAFYGAACECYSSAAVRDVLVSRDWFGWRLQGFKPADIVLRHMRRGRP